MGWSYYILMPFSLLLLFFYRCFNSYGMALIFFALVVKLILYPFSIKGKRSMIQMNMLSGKVQKLQKQYGKDQAKYNAKLQELYEKENVSPMSGCLWSFVPLLILFPLYAIIRQPLTYLMGATADQIASIANSLDWGNVAVNMGWATPDAISKALAASQEAVAEGTAAVVSSFSNTGYNQMYLVSLLSPETLEAAQAAAGATPKALFSMNFDFMGINLALQPALKFWAKGLNWESIGLFLIPLVSAGTSLLFSLVSTRTNSMNGQQAQDAQTKSTNRMMMIMTPLMSLWIGFSMPAALSIYWIANNLLGMFQEWVSAKVLKKDYEKAAAEAKRREIEEKEEEKRERREKAERRAREAEEARKNKAKRKEVETAEADKISPEVRAASRVGMRQYARGRAYDPNRFGGVTPYHEELISKEIQAAEAAARAAEQKAEEARAAAVEIPEETSSVAEEASVSVKEEPAVETPAPEEAESGTDGEPPAEQAVPAEEEPEETKED